MTTYNDKKLNSFSKKVADLSDTPSGNMTPQQIKEWFDSAPNEMRQAFNSLIDKLNVEDVSIKSRLTSAADNLNTLNSLTAEQSQGISDLVNEVNSLGVSVAKQGSALYDYSVPVSVSNSGIPYMFFVTDDGVLGVEEQVPQKTYYQDYLVSPDGSKFQTFSEDDGTIVVYKVN